MREILLALLVVLMAGCASVKSLPQSAAEVAFENTLEGKTGWSEYQGLISVAKVDERTAYEAAKAGLRSAGFTVTRGDFENLTVLGQHGCWSSSGSAPAARSYGG